MEDLWERLGVSRDRVTTESYGTLFLRWCEDTGSPAQNLTFGEVYSPVAQPV